MDVKKRKISKKDWDSVASTIREEYKSRKGQKFRKAHEAVWTEIDRQIDMRPMERKAKDGKTIDPEWRSVMELGELAKASEIITADVMRLTFPTNRSWFEVHSEIPGQLAEDGTNRVDPKAQDYVDRTYRALLVQQHLDFGLKGRYELSVKEALHHGSYVAEIRWDKRIRIDDNAGVEQVSAPIWVPYSMWNAFPDPSPSVIGTDLFYTGSMILVDYIPLYLLKAMAHGEGWMTDNVNKIKVKKNTNKDVETEDVELIKYYGDVEIKRNDGNILLPNSKVILANDEIVYYSTNDLPFPSIIYSGYERMDVRDPYYTSPLIKLSPMQKLGSQLANKLIDSMWMKVEPPIAYDANDPQLVLDGGPDWRPGAKIGVKGSYGVKEIQAGDPASAMTGLEFIIAQLNQGLGINAIRSGAGSDVADKTATEITTADTKAEIRTSEFVDKQERHALRPFLHMQHLLNKKNLGTYTFYNPELDAPDFGRVHGSEIPEVVVFDVVGSRGAIGEKARAQRVGEVTAFLLSNPRTAGLPKVEELAKQAYQDAGVKNPEKYLNVDQSVSPEVQQAIQQAQEAIQQAQERINELEKENAIIKAVNEAKVQEAQTRAHIEGELAQFKAEVSSQMEALKSVLKVYETEAKNNAPSEDLKEIGQAISQMANMVAMNAGGGNQALSAAAQAIADAAEKMSRPKSVMVRRGEDGSLSGEVQ